jgi:hypothetical protein
MAGRLIIPGICPTLDANGKIDPTASFQFYENRTTTPQAIYATQADADAGGPGTLINPLEPDSSGRLPEIWGPDGSIYTVEWTPTGESPITYNDIGLAANPNPSTAYYDMYRWKVSAPGDAETIIKANIPRPLTLPQDLNDGVFPSLFSVDINPTATTVLTIARNGGSIGSISFSTGGVPTVSFPNEVSLVAGDVFSVANQATADATAAGFALTFVFRAD